MQLRDPGGWAADLAANQDPYGQSIARYIMRWSDLMEERLAEGEVLAEIVLPTASAANTEGLTGFMQSIAARVLERVWDHGEDLRKLQQFRD